MNGVRVRRKGPAAKVPDGNAVESYAYDAAGRLVRKVSILVCPLSGIIQAMIRWRFLKKKEVE